PLPYTTGPLAGMQVDPSGVLNDLGNDPMLLLCKSCLHDVNGCKVPQLSLANGTYVGPIPHKLEDLMIVKESMIALCQVKCMMLQLKEENGTVNLPTIQCGLKGNVIVYPQCPSKVSRMPPPSIDEITSPICILFVGAQLPMQDWLKNHVKPLAVSGHCVQWAFACLKTHNPHYHDILLNECVL
ncbi:hypothetical protein ARMGADRAFT_883351, partial [Armillaria gallica]